MSNFEKYIDKAGDCWRWTAHKNANGYGQYHYDGHTQYAHRIAYSLYVARIPAGKLVLHKCDNPSCVNPSHLFIGTHKDNTADMIAKGRHLAGREQASKLLKGRKLSAFTRELMSAAKRGSKHVRACKVVIDGTEYPTQTAAAKALGLTRQAIHYRVKQSNQL